MNVDGAQAKVANRGAWAVVCRNGAGLYQGSNAVVMDGTYDPQILEGLAFREALGLTQDMCTASSCYL